MMMMMMDISQQPVLPDDLIAEILSYLSVKTLMRLKTVNKSWKTLISNPTFVNLHLQRSHRNTHLTIELEWVDDDEENFVFCRVLSLFPVHRLLQNPPIIVHYHTLCVNVELQKDYIDCDGPYQGEYSSIVGSYNGLLCFYSRHKVIGDHSDSDQSDSDDYSDRYYEYWLNFRNPAMGTISERLGHFLNSETVFCRSFKFSFGYDHSTATYKVVAFCLLAQHNGSPSWTSEVKIFSLGDNSWRNIQSFPVPPLTFPCDHAQPSYAVHLNGTINWLALTNTSRSSFEFLQYAYILPRINSENLVILSLSLSTETYTQLLLPKGFNEVLHFAPTLWVLRNCLCFSHDFRGTEFVLWQMREYGVQESWTQLIKVSYQTLGRQNLPMGDRMYCIRFLPLLPLYLSEDSNTLIFASKKEDHDEDNQALIYNWKDDRVERTRFSKEVSWFHTMDYVESLVPTPCNCFISTSSTLGGC